MPQLPIVTQWPAWSHDSRYMYFMSDLDIYRVPISGGSAELVASASGMNLMCPGVPWGNWFSLTPDDRILVLRDRGTDELYALDLEYH